MFSSKFFSTTCIDIAKTSKLTHRSLVKIARKLRHSNINGLCHGISMSWVYDWHDSRGQNFNSILKNLAYEVSSNHYNNISLSSKDFISQVVFYQNPRKNKLCNSLLIK